MRTFLYIDGIGHEISRPGSRTAAGLLIASRGLLAPAEGISVPFVARVRGSTPSGVVVGRVDAGRVLLVQHPCRALVESVTSSGETTDRRQIGRASCRERGEAAGRGGVVKRQAAGTGAERE